MKYWIADIEDVNGEFEYKQPIIFKAKTKEEADKNIIFIQAHGTVKITWFGMRTIIVFIMNMLRFAREL